MAKCYVLKEAVSITFTPDEIFDLIICCEGDKSYCKNAMDQHPKGSLGYLEYKKLYDKAEELQQKIIDIRNTSAVLEDI